MPGDVKTMWDIGIIPIHLKHTAGRVLKGWLRPEKPAGAQSRVFFVFFAKEFGFQPRVNGRNDMVVPCKVDKFQRVKSRWRWT